MKADVAGYMLLGHVRQGVEAIAMLVRAALLLSPWHAV